MRACVCFFHLHWPSYICVYCYRRYVLFSVLYTIIYVGIPAEFFDANSLILARIYPPVSFIRSNSLFFFKYKFHCSCSVVAHNTDELSLETFVQPSFRFLFNSRAGIAKWNERIHAIVVGFIEYNGCKSQSCAKQSTRRLSVHSCDGCECFLIRIVSHCSTISVPVKIIVCLLLAEKSNCLSIKLTKTRCDIGLLWMWLKIINHSRCTRTIRYTVCSRSYCMDSINKIAFLWYIVRHFLWPKMELVPYSMSLIELITSIWCHLI